ncbi:MULTISPECIES: hypothetical protein [Deferribacter]|uniref:MoaD/ThiS family protein n=1 Tax=Deferribacter autotrophicus TaxID=500465 RepID=A0A5A8F3F1_9BACT|nr:hypothetical protein [Deferribacter autotrophicus]KAA0258537.1 hypothetical protein FHQ18_05105 [Deferribacter autotrophicus]
MPLLKFIGLLQKKYGEKIFLNYEGKLSLILQRIMEKEDMENEYLQILVNGKYTKDLSLHINQNDIITLYIIGGTGYPGG